MKCVKCKAELPEGSKFCKYCGAPQAAPQPEAKPKPQTITCRQCGKELPAGSKFCKYCGASQTEAKPGDPAKAPIVERGPVTVPEPVSKPEPVAAPEPTSKPEPVVTPEPVSKPEPVAAPEPISKPEPVVAPKPVSKPEPVAAPESISKPEPVVAPEPISKPEAGPKPGSVAAPSDPVKVPEKPVTPPGPVKVPEKPVVKPATTPGTEGKSVQNSQPMVACRQCGKGLPAGSKFCKYCGASQEEPKKEEPKKKDIQRGGPERVIDYEQQKPKKHTGLIIGCILAAVILLAAVGILAFLLLRPEDSEGSKEPSRQEREVEEEEEGRDEEEESSETPESGEPSEAPESGEPSETPESGEPTPETTEPAEPAKPTGEEAYLAKKASGISGSIDYGVTAYEPNSMDYGQVWDEASGQRIYSLIQGELKNDLMLTGTLYSMSEDRTLSVEVYYHPETYDIEKIVTVQLEGDHQLVYEAFFKEGKLLMVSEYPSKGYEQYAVNISGQSYTFMYAEDRLVTLNINREDGSTDTYNCADFESMEDGVQSLFLVREAEYLNRAYTTYAAVTQ